MAKVRSSLLTVVVFLLAFSIGQALIISIKRARQAEQRRALLETASNYASSLQRQLERSLSSTFALASLVQRGQGHVENFELLAATLIAFHEGLRSLQLAPKGVVSHVYPLTGNETILGRDLFKDPRCRAQVMRSMQSGELSLTSPFALPQGGQGIMGHLPVFLSSSTGKKVFWGFTVAVLRLSDLLEGSHINLLPEAGYAYELSARRPESQERIVLARSGKLIPSQATSVSIAVPAGHWTLSLSLPSSPFPLGAAHLLVGLCSLLIASFAYRMARQPEVLRQRIAQRTQELARQKRSEKLLLEQMKHLQTMQEVTKEITRELNLISLLHLISQRAAALVGVSSGAIFLWEEATQELVPQFWPDHWGCMEGRRLRLGEGVVGTVARRRAGMIVNDYRSSPYALSTALERGGVQAVLAEPLLYRDRLLGVIVLQTEQAHQTFSEQDRQILSLFAGQAAIAIENARLHETTLQHAQQLTMLNELTRTLTMVLDPRRVAQQILVAAQKIIPGAVGRLWEGVGENSVLSASLGLRNPAATQRLAPHEGLAGIAAMTRQPVISQNLAEDPRFVNKEWAASEGLTSAIVLPLVFQDHVSGTLVIFTRTPHDFSEIEVHILQAFAAQAAIAIENARLFHAVQEQATRLIEANRELRREISERKRAVEELERSERTQRQLAQENRVMANIGRIINSSFQIDEVYERFAEEVRTLLPFDRIAIGLVDFDRYTLTLAYDLGIEVPNRHCGSVLPLSGRFAEEVVHTRTGRICPLESEEWLATHFPSLLPDFRAGIRSILMAPLIVQDSVVGVLYLGSTLPQAYSDADLIIAGNVAAQVAGAIANAQLYAHQRQAEEALQESNRRLEEALTELRQTQQHIVQQERLHALGTMASGIAHDFNNTLAPILGFSELILHSPDLWQDRERLRHYLQTIHTAAQGAAKVVNRLREFYRHRDKGELFLPLELNALIEQTILLTQPRWKDQALARGITIQVITDLQPIPLLNGNEAELRDVLINLIFNAVDAMPEGGLLSLHTCSEDNEVVLTLRDTGVGMSEEVQQRCLEPFFSTKGERGSGLGLAMVYGIVQRHQGTISIESREGEGTTVTLRFPALAEMPPPEEQQPGATLPQTLHVLVVEDEPEVREVIEAYLAADGHTVETAADGEEGLEKFRQGRFDLVVTDRAMPVLSGDELAAAVKQMAPEVPVIMLTGFGAMMQAAGEQPAGVDHVVSKPVTLNEWREALARVMGRCG